MRHRSPTARSAALAIAAVVATSACSGADQAAIDAVPGESTDGEPAAAPSSDAPAADTTDAADTPAADASPSPATTASSAPSPTSSASSAPTPAPAASSSSAPPAPSDGTLQPVQAGTWSYATKGWSQLGENPRRDLPARTSLVVTAAGSDDVQDQTRDTRDKDGYGSRNTITLRYGVEGVVLLGSLLESTVDVFGSPFTQVTELEADPPALIAPNGVDVGDRASLHLVGDEVEVDGTMTVVARETLTVGGQPVDTLKVEVQYVLTGEIEGTSNATWWVRPSDLLIVREISRTDVTSRGLRYREEYESMLARLSPA